MAKLRLQRATNHAGRDAKHRPVGTETAIGKTKKEGMNRGGEQFAYRVIGALRPEY